MIGQVVTGAARSLGGGITVLRVLPQVARRSLGPFVFVDLFGPLEMQPYAMAVRPHPHIGLATVTYLFAGRMTHRDSLGTHAIIRPGAINWMTAGRGIVHSERSEDHAGTQHGLQLWVALPEADQECEPAFQTVPAEAIPAWSDGPLAARLLVGGWCGRRSPVVPASETLYADLQLAPGADVGLPREHEEVGVLPVSGEVRVCGEPVPVGSIAVLAPGSDVRVSSDPGGRCVVLGGTPLGPRHMWWNFVHTDPARIEQARADWHHGRFAPVPGEPDVMPLPEGR